VLSDIHVARLGSASATNSGSNLIFTVPPGGVPVGHWVLVGYCSNSASGDGAITCFDSKGNFYTPDEGDTQGQRRTVLFAARITTALVGGDTITATVPTPCTRRAMDLLEVVGIQAKDVSASTSGNSTSPSVGPTSIRSHEDAFVVGVCGWNNTVGGDLFTGTASFAGSENTVESALGAVTARYVATEYKTVTKPVGTNTAAGTLPSSQGWSMLVAVYPAEDLLTWVTGDHVHETTVTTGTGDVTLGGAADSKKVTFGSIAAHLDLVAYALVHQSAAEWEVGIGRYTTGGILQRYKVLQSSNGGALVSFSAGTKDVFNNFPAGHGLLPACNRDQTTDVFIPDSASVTVSGKYRISSGKKCTLGLDATLRIN
jgi:hypothetical protein